MCFWTCLHWSVCVVGRCCFCISHFLETVVTRTCPNNSLICRCGLAPTLHARGCLARGVLFAGHPVRIHNGFQGWLWKKQFSITHTGPQDMLDITYFGGVIYLWLVMGGGGGEGGRRFRFCASLQYIHYTCGMDCWTWSSWICFCIAQSVVLMLVFCILRPPFPVKF